jgi:hypothetical protein
MAIRVTPKSEPIPLNVVGSSTFGDYPKISLEKTYNMIESDGWLVPFPGYHKVLELSATGRAGRGFFKSVRGNRMIAVVDSQVYDIDFNLSPRVVGTLNTSHGEVFMDENLENQICIVDGVNMYIYNYTIPSLTLQTGGALTGPNAELVPNYVTYHNTYFLIGNAATNGFGSNWYAYDYASPTTITEHSVMQLQTKPDNALAIKRIPAQAANVLVFGNTVCEIHTNVPGLGQLNTEQDYQRNNSVGIDYGCLSVSTIAESGEYIAWLGANETNLPVIMVMKGQSVQRISTDGIDFLLQDLSFPAQSTAMMYSTNGHLFYQLTFYNEADNVTLAYDFNNEKFYHLSDHNLNYHPAVDIVSFSPNLTTNPNLENILEGIYQNTFFLSLNNGCVYQLSQDFYDINEDINDDVFAGTDPNLRFEMQRIRICKNIRFPTSAPFKANQLVFTIEMGMDNLPATQDCLIYMVTEQNIRIFSEYESGYEQVVPEGAGNEDCLGVQYQGRIDLAISKTGNEAFSNYVPRYMHHTGHQKNMLRWNKMGRANDLVPKIRFWSLGRIVATDGYVEVTP